MLLFESSPIADGRKEANSAALDSRAEDVRDANYMPELCTASEMNSQPVDNDDENGGGTRGVLSSPRVREQGEEWRMVVAHPFEIEAMRNVEKPYIGLESGPRLKLVSWWVIQEF